MSLKRIHHILFIACCMVCLSVHSGFATTLSKKFVVVIDAGHGGHDPGAVGRISKEKNINLGVALQLGNLIKEQCPDTKVIYTRSRDVFIPLSRRAEIANEAKANLEVAKRENAVILYEDDYKTRYAGFNPNSAESYIIFEFMQDKYMSQSVHLASLVQKEFRQTGKRIDRGVHQAGFLVLKASAMPSILVELGFISNPTEERYLNSEVGRKTLANSIFRAFLAYKQEQELRLNGSKTVQKPEAISKEKPANLSLAPVQNQSAASASNAKTQPDSKRVPVFKVQILTSSKALPANDKRFKGLKGVDSYKEDGLYKYTYGSSTDYNEILRIKKSVAKQIKDAFIIAFKNGKKMDTAAAIREFKGNKK